jgi:hypothetical protein
VPIKKISTKDTEALEAHAREQAEAAAEAELAVERLREASAAGNGEAFSLELPAAGSGKQNNRLPRRVNVTLTWCKSCEGGKVSLMLASGVGEKTTFLNLGETKVPPEFVRRIVAE